MNKLLASIALLGLGAAGTIGTLNEASAPAPEMPDRGVSKKLSMGVTQLNYKYFAIADTTTKVVNGQTKPLEDLDVTPSQGRILAASDFSSDARSGTHSLKMKNQTLGVRFGVLPTGGNYTLSFWAKQLSVQSENRFSIRFDNMDAAGTRQYYASGNINLKVGEWAQYTYKFTGTHFENGAYILGRTSFNMIAYGDYLIDDITLTDGNNVNYILDGDFEPIEALGWESLWSGPNVGFAKQTDGSVLMGFCTNALDTSVTEAFVQINPKMTGSGKNVTVTFEFTGGDVGALNRNNYEDTTTKTLTAGSGWETFTYAYKSDIVANQALYFGLNRTKNVAYIRNISAKDADGNEYIPYNLTKEGYVEALADTLLDTVVCDGGVTAPDSKTWGDMSYCYGSIPKASQDYIKSFTPNATGSKIEQALYKYSYIISKYGKKTYGDFLGYLDSGKATSNKFFLEDSASKSGFYVGLAITVAALTAGVFALALEKKKKSVR